MPTKSIRLKMAESKYFKNKMIYTGVGSRAAPQHILDKIRILGKRLAEEWYTLRSGSANGVDKFFEMGCIDVLGPMEIYLPWKRFNGNMSLRCEVSEEAIEMAKSIHPAPHRLTNKSLLLHARNCYQVLGYDLKTPSDFVLCWTPNGKVIGGTATAIRLAKKHKIPVFNLGKLENIDVDKIIKYIEEKVYGY